MTTGNAGDVLVDEHLRTANPRIWAAGARHGPMADGQKLAAQTYTRDVSKLSCCAS